MRIPPSVVGVVSLWLLALVALAVQHRNVTMLRTDPESSPLLLYRGDEALERSGVRCLPVDRFLRGLVPGRDLPL